MTVLRVLVGPTVGLRTVLSTWYAVAGPTPYSIMKPNAKIRCQSDNHTLKALQQEKHYFHWNFIQNTLNNHCGSIDSEGQKKQRVESA